MRFALPELLWLLWLLPALFAVLWGARALARRKLSLFAAAERLDELRGVNSGGRRIVRATLRLAALSLLILAAARPQWGASEVDVEQKGIDLVVALDISRSMEAEDIKPSRLTRAKAELGNLIDSLRGDRVGLVLFAGASFPQCPLTVDYSAARMFLSQAEPTMMGDQGTDLGSALSTCMELFGEEDGRFRVVLLVTDGEDFGDGVELAAKELSKRGILLYAVGIGTLEGAPIPSVDDRGVAQGFVRDAENQVVISRLNDAPLLDLTRSTGGVYVRAGTAGIDTQRLLNEIEAMEGDTYAARRVTSYEERFIWPLAAALLLLMGEAIVADRRRRSS